MRFTRAGFNFMGTVGQHLELVEWLLFAAAAPLLLFPSQHTLLGAALIAAAWLTRRVASGRWSVPSPRTCPPFFSYSRC